MALLDALLTEAGVNIKDVGVVGFGCGPGSFTGVRMAASVTQALSYAAAAKVVPVPSARVWLESALSSQSSAGYWLTSIKSRGEAHYLTLYKVADGQVSLLQASSLVDGMPQWLTDCQPNWADFKVVGQYPNWLAAPLAERWVAKIEPSARAILNYVSRAHEAGESVTPELALPVYVDGDSPWVKAAQPG